jgi:DNA polymerase I-like protein with 3'-5' exonuclease and polymerase domains
MIDIYRTGEDIHLGCAKLAGQAPPEATLETHKSIRQAFKICNFRLAYGSSVRGLATQLGSMGRAQYFYDVHRAAFPACHEYLERSISYARTHSVVELPDGWRKRILPPFKSSVAANFPIQAMAAGVLRRGVVASYQAGLPLIATVHDALVFECQVDEVEALVRTVTQLMGDASEWFIPGLRLKVDVSASKPLPRLAHLNIGPLADPTLRAAYDLVLRRAGQRQRGVA